MTSKSYVLSKPAQVDLEEIFDYTVINFGFDQAIKYVSSFDDTFKNLLKNSELGRPRNEIKKDLRSLIHRNHAIYYTSIKNQIRIIRILHGSKDLHLISNI